MPYCPESRGKCSLFDIMLATFSIHLVHLIYCWLRVSCVQPLSHWNVFLSLLVSSRPFSWWDAELSFWETISVSAEMIMNFILRPNHVLCYPYSSVYVEIALCPWTNTTLVMVNGIFTVFEILLARILLRSFLSRFIKETGLKFSFSSCVLIWFW